MTFAAYVRLASLWMLTTLAVCTSGLGQRQLFRRYGANEGLTNLNVTCLLQDHVGFLWVGTDNGLFRYDGVSFRLFGHAEGLPSTEIKSLAESPGGMVWAATSGGAARLSGERFERVDVGETEQIDNLLFDSTGQLFVKNYSGILRGVPDAANVYHFSRVHTGRVWAMSLVDGRLVFGQDLDLWSIGSDGSKDPGSSAGLPADRWDSAVQDSLGNLWVRSSTRLFERVGGQGRFVDRSEGVPHTPEGRLLAGRHGRVFVTSIGGVVILDHGRRTIIDSHHGLPADSVSTMLIDREESLWLGVDGAGLTQRLGHGEWESWTKEDGLLHNSVWAIRTDRTGQAWVGTTSGLTIFGRNGKVVRSWTAHSGLAGDRVLSIANGPSNDFYVGTDPAGISHFDERGNLLKTYRPAMTGYGADQVTQIVFDRENRLWAMGRGGCFRTREPVTHDPELKFERVEIPGVPLPTVFRAGILDADGNVWLASSAGLLRFDGAKWKVFNEKDGLVSTDVASLAMAPGSLWVSYRDAFGVSRLDLRGDGFQPHQFTTANGLSSDTIYALARDSAGRLWASSDAGVDVFENGHWARHYGSQNGLIWNDADSLALNIDPAGEVWVGTSGGLSRYTPLAYAIPELSPPVVFTSIRGVSREWNAEDQPVLPHAERSLSIQYAALSFASPADVRFRYRLIGYEKDWNETRERNVHFAALPAGHYVFEVKSAGANGVWSAVPARFTFSIKPAWWQRWWFIASCLLLASFVGYVFWYLRLRSLMAQKVQLEAQVAARTAELIESHRQLEEFAYFDLLTSLPNRRMFAEEFRKRLAMAKRPSEPFALLLMDLDHFKQINDTYGHDAGDAVLVETGCVLRALVRESDCVARLGGDEFAVLLFTAQEVDTVETVCRRILGSFSTGVPFNGTSLQVGCSIGIAMYPEHGRTQEGLYKSADLALYEAKRTGRNTFCWHSAEALTALEAQAKS